METLTSRIARHGALTPLDAVGWIVRLARALERGHARGLIHRRVSPHCLLIEDSDPSSAGRLVEPEGAPDLLVYQSPERVAGKEPAPSDDAWGVAVTLYEALTGLAAFEGAQDETALADLQEMRPAPLVAFGVEDAELQAIFNHALTPEWMERTNNLSALRRALEAWRPAARLGGLAPLEDPRLPAAARRSATIPPGGFAHFRASMAPPPAPASEPEEESTRFRLAAVDEREERAVLPLVEAPAPEPEVEEDTRIFMAEGFPFAPVPAAAVERVAAELPPEPEPEAAREPVREPELPPEPEVEAARVAEPEPAAEVEAAAEPVSAPRPESVREKPAVAAPPPVRAAGGSRTRMMVGGVVVLGGIAALVALRREEPSVEGAPSVTVAEVRVASPPVGSSPAVVTTAAVMVSATATATATAMATATAAVSVAPVGDLKACVRQVFPSDTFTAGAMPDFGFLCEETIRVAGRRG